MLLLNRMKLFYRGAQLLYVATAVQIVVKYAAQGVWTQALLGPLSLVFLLIPKVAEWVLRIRLSDRSKAVIVLFTWLGFQLGTALKWYYVFVGIDNVIHLMSGMLFFVIGLMLYKTIQDEGYGDKKRDWLLKLCFAFFFSMFVAVIWECFEFFGFLLTGHDAQHHLDTGVFDTMEDLLSCIGGSLIMTVSYLLHVHKNTPSFLLKMVDEMEVTRLKK